MAIMMKPLEELEFTDDFMFSRVMSDLETAKMFIEALFDHKIEKVSRHVVQSQHGAEDPDKHGIRFDVEFVGDGKLYDIEMQLSAEGGETELVRRARYYHSKAATDNLRAGDKYRNLIDSCVIFLCTFDLFGQGLSQYTLRTEIVELGKDASDGQSTIILNSKYTHPNSTAAVEALLDYMDDPVQGANFTEPLIQKVAGRVASCKVSPSERRAYMNLQEYAERHTRDGIRAVLKDMGLPDEEIEMRIAKWESSARETVAGANDKLLIGRLNLQP